MKTFRIYFTASGYMDFDAETEDEAIGLFNETDIDTGDLGEVDDYDIEEIDSEDDEEYDEEDYQ